MSAEDYAAAEDQGKIVAVLHSHPDASAVPTDADRKHCELSGMPWYILSVLRRIDGSPECCELRRFEPDGYQAPLIGRQFTHGVLDCWTLVQDWFERQRGIALPDFPRQDDWWSNGGDLYMDHFEEAGFSPIKAGDRLRPGDLIMMNVRSEKTNHGGVFIGTEPLREDPHLFPVPDAMLHHLYGQLSCRDVYGGQWREQTRLIARHRDL